MRLVWNTFKFDSQQIFDYIIKRLNIPAFCLRL